MVPSWCVIRPEHMNPIDILNYRGHALKLLTLFMVFKHVHFVHATEAYIN